MILHTVSMYVFPAILPDSFNFSSSFSSLSSHAEAIYLPFLLLFTERAPLHCRCKVIAPDLDIRDVQPNAVMAASDFHREVKDIPLS